MSLDDIADDIGTVEEHQHDDNHDRVQTTDIETRDMEEYDGGWSTGQ